MALNHDTLSLIDKFKQGGNDAMKGGIYSRQKCPVCGSALVDDRSTGLYCKTHPDQKASKFLVWHPPNISRNFKDYQQAYDFLYFVRGQVRAGLFDERDFRQDNPLGFSNLVDEYITFKSKRIRSWADTRYHLTFAAEFFKDRNIKTIGNRDLEKIRDSLPSHLSQKTIHNIFTSLHAFYTWVKDGEEDRVPSFRIPKFPKIEFQLAWRKILDRETQWAVLEEVKRISWQVNPKIYLGCLWLSTYTSVRPVELLNVKEGEFDLSNGILQITHNKERKPKRVFLLAEDVEAVKSFPPAMPHLPFFRHGAGIKGVTAGEQFGDKYLAKWWAKATRNLGISGVPLYLSLIHI